MTSVFSPVFFLTLWLLPTFYFPPFLCLFLGSEGSEKFPADVTMKLTTSWHLSEMKNLFSASVSSELSLNQIQTKRKGCGCQSAVLTAHGVDATWAESSNAPSTCLSS